MKVAFITFGCSWTYGVGCNYLIDNPPKTEKEFKKDAWNTVLADQYSFRGILSKKYNLTNINFSVGGSSNQTQFRLAKEFFMSPKYNELVNEYDKIVVLWGITSTARYELYSLQLKDYFSFFYHTDIPLWPINKIMLKYCYDHDVVVKELSLEMKFWDEFFYNRGIKNVWFDTFNHHNYEYTKNLLFADIENRDILSTLTRNEGLDKIQNKYHFSLWADEGRQLGNITDHLEFLVTKNILNPYSMHPTREGHEKISSILSPEIEKLIC